MKTFLKLALITAAVAVQPTFALLEVKTPDGGSTAVLALISVAGLLVGKNFLKKQ